MDIMRQRNLNCDWRQMNNSGSNKKYTLRGLHFQQAPEEIKFVRCIAGKIWDVVVDLRLGSKPSAKVDLNFQ